MGEGEFFSYWNFKVYEIHGVWTNELGCWICCKNWGWIGTCWTVCCWVNWIGVGFVLMTEVWFLDGWLIGKGAGAGNWLLETGFKICWLEITCLLYTKPTLLVEIGNWDWDGDFWLSIVDCPATTFCLLFGSWFCDVNTICFWEPAETEFWIEAWDTGTLGLCVEFIFMVFSPTSVTTLAGIGWVMFWYPTGNASTLTWVLAMFLFALKLNCFSEWFCTNLVCLIGCSCTVTEVGVGTTLTLLSTGAMLEVKLGWGDLTCTFLLTVASCGFTSVLSWMFCGWETTLTYSLNLGVCGSE